jgi:hypothetical protein
MAYSGSPPRCSSWTSPSTGTPLAQVPHAWPAYLAYVISFLTIGVSWLLPAVIGYAIPIPIGFRLPVEAVALYCGLAVYLVMPFRDIARVLIRRYSSRWGAYRS